MADRVFRAGLKEVITQPLWDRQVYGGGRDVYHYFLCRNEPADGNMETSGLLRAPMSMVVRGFSVVPEAGAMRLDIMELYDSTVYTFQIAKKRYLSVPFALLLPAHLAVALLLGTRRVPRSFLRSRRPLSQPAYELATPVLIPTLTRFSVVASGIPILEAPTLVTLYIHGERVRSVL